MGATISGIVRAAMGLKARPPRRSRRLVAFLRAINVGGRTVTKDRLVSAFAAAGLRDAETFIASGNVAFDAPDSALGATEQKIAAALRSECGVGATRAEHESESNDKSACESHEFLLSHECPAPTRTFPGWVAKRDRIGGMC